MSQDLMKSKYYQFLVNAVRRKNKPYLLALAFLLFFSMLLPVSNVWLYLDTNNNLSLIFVGISISFNILLICFFLHALFIQIKPDKSRYIRRINNLKDILEDLEINEKKVNGFYIGNRSIVSMNNSLMIADQREILTAWYIHKRNSGTGSVSNIEISTYNRTILVPVTRSSDVKDFLNTLATYCPNCRIGYNKENLQYLKDERKIRKAEKETN